MVMFKMGAFELGSIPTLGRAQLAISDSGVKHRIAVVKHVQSPVEHEGRCI